MLALLALLAALLAPVMAHAQDGTVELALRPIDQTGQFFDVTMHPGETRTLEVELANVGDAAIAVRTYAADVYTIINGGFGARLRDEPQTGTTLWLDYPTDVLQLPAGKGIRRTFTVAVPADAEPGEYITSLVLENDEPIRGSGDVALDQIVRQAIAVVVTVPGQRSPALAIGAGEPQGRDRQVGRRGRAREQRQRAAQARRRVRAARCRRCRGQPGDRPDGHVLRPHRRRSSRCPSPRSSSPARTASGSRSRTPPRTSGRTKRRSRSSSRRHPSPTRVGGLIPGLTEVIQAVQDGRIPLPVGVAILVGSLVLGIVIGWLVLVLRRRRRTRASKR